MSCRLFSLFSEEYLKEAAKVLVKVEPDLAGVVLLEDPQRHLALQLPSSRI